MNIDYRGRKKDHRKRNNPPIYQTEGIQFRRVTDTRGERGYRIHPCVYVVDHVVHRLLLSSSSAAESNHITSFTLTLLCPRHWKENEFTTTARRRITSPT